MGGNRKKTFQLKEIESLLDLIHEEAIVVGKMEWETIARRHRRRFPDNDRTAEALKRKFEGLYGMKPGTGQTVMPPHIERAKRLWEEIKGRVGMATDPDEDEETLPPERNSLASTPEQPKTGATTGRRVSPRRADSVAELAVTVNEEEDTSTEEIETTAVAPTAAVTASNKRNSFSSEKEKTSSNKSSAEAAARKRKDSFSTPMTRVASKPRRLTSVYDQNQNDSQLDNFIKWSIVQSQQEAAQRAEDRRQQAEDRRQSQQMFMMFMGSMMAQYRPPAAFNNMQPQVYPTAQHFPRTAPYYPTSQQQHAPQEDNHEGNYEEDEDEGEGQNENDEGEDQN